MAHAAAAAKTTFAIQSLCGGEWQKKLSAVKKVQGSKYMEGTKETYRKKDIQETLGTTILFSAEFFRGFFGRRKGEREDGESEKAGKRERVKWRD